MVDNFKLISDFITFDSDDDFYFMPIMQRAKENPEIGCNNRIIRTYYIKSKEYLSKHEDEIKSLCDLFNARAYIYLTKRSYKKTCLLTLNTITANLMSDTYKGTYKAFDHACGVQFDSKTKKWIIDIDTKDVDEMNKVKDAINKCRPEGDKVLLEVPTKNGIHLITVPFDLKEFRSIYTDEIDIHKNNPTVLYMN